MFRWGGYFGGPGLEGTPILKWPDTGQLLDCGNPLLGVLYPPGEDPREADQENRDQVWKQVEGDCWGVLKYLQGAHRSQNKSSDPDLPRQPDWPDLLLQITGGTRRSCQEVSGNCDFGWNLRDDHFRHEPLQHRQVLPWGHYHQHRHIKMGRSRRMETWLLCLPQAAALAQRCHGRRCFRKLHFSLCSHPICILPCFPALPIDHLIRAELMQDPQSSLQSNIWENPWRDKNQDPQAWRWFLLLSGLLVLQTAVCREEKNLQICGFDHKPIGGDWVCDSARFLLRESSRRAEPPLGVR